MIAEGIIDPAKVTRSRAAERRLHRGAVPHHRGRRGRQAREGGPHGRPRRVAWAAWTSESDPSHLIAPAPAGPSAPAGARCPVSADVRCATRLVGRAGARSRQAAVTSEVVDGAASRRPARRAGRAAAPVLARRTDPAHRRGRPRRHAARCAGAGSTTLPRATRCRGRTASRGNCLRQRRARRPSPAGALAARIADRRPPAEVDRAGADEATTALAEALAACGPTTPSCSGCGRGSSSTPGRDRDRPRHHRQRREHPAAPRPREAGRRAAKDRRPRPDMRSREEGTGPTHDRRRAASARLRAADPAASLPPADPARVARLPGGRP